MEYIWGSELPSVYFITNTKHCITYLALTAVSCVADKLVSHHATYLCVLIHIWIKGEVGAPLNRFKPSSDRSKAVLLLWIVYVCVLSCVCYVFVRVCLYVLCDHLLGKGWPLGSFVVSNCEFVTFPLVSWVGCGTWLYWFLIFASLLTLHIMEHFAAFHFSHGCVHKWHMNFISSIFVRFFFQYYLGSTLLITRYRCICWSVATVCAFYLDGQTEETNSDQRTYQCAVWSGCLYQIAFWDKQCNFWPGCNVYVQPGQCFLQKPLFCEKARI